MALPLSVRGWDCWSLEIVANLFQQGKRLLPGSTGIDGRIEPSKRAAIIDRLGILFRWTPLHSHGAGFPPGTGFACGNVAVHQSVLVEIAHWLSVDGIRLRRLALRRSLRSAMQLQLRGEPYKYGLVQNPQNSFLLMALADCDAGVLGEIPVLPNLRPTDLGATIDDREVQHLADTVDGHQRQLGSRGWVRVGEQLAPCRRLPFHHHLTTLVAGLPVGIDVDVIQLGTLSAFGHTVVAENLLRVDQESDVLAHDLAPHLSVDGSVFLALAARSARTSMCSFTPGFRSAFSAMAEYTRASSSKVSLEYASDVGLAYLYSPSRTR